MGEGARTALLDRELKDRVEFVLRNDEGFTPIRVALRERAMVGGVRWLQLTGRFDLID